MLSMDTEHPDIDKFIKAKSDADKITHANISVRSSGEFFKLDTPEKKHTLNLIAENNWATGEPGMLFWDRVEEWHLLSKHPKYELYSTNPCFTGDMEVLTTQGYKSFKELEGNEVDLINIDGDISRGTVWHTGDKETIQLTLSNHKKIKCTPDHRFLTKEGKEVEAKNLKGERLHPLLEEFKEKDLQYVKYGFIQGDGGLTRLSSKSHKGLEVYIGETDEDIRELFKDEEFTEQGKGIIYLQGNYTQKLKSLGFSDKQLPEREFPSTYNDWTMKQKASFLQGMYSANGSVITNHRVSYKTTCIELAHQLLDTLENDFGITGYITTNKPTKVKFDNGTYVCRQSYDVNISRYDSLQIFHREINFYHQYKKDNLKNLLLHKAPKVMSIKEIGVQPVYDFNEPKTNWGVVEGFIAHNCGEQPLPPFGNCLLGSINLSNFVEKPFTSDAYIDYERLEEVIRISIAGLNEVLHEGIPLHPLKEQRETANKFRQIGLGIMGLSDMFIKLGIKYGSDKSIELSDELGKFIRNIAIEESISLVGKYGVYPEYDFEYIKESSYFKSLPNHLQERIKEKGMANSHVLSIAPTGSISTMFGVSGGIEPIFANSFTRTTKSLASEGDVEYKVYAEVIQELMDAKGIEKESDLPNYCITSHDIDPQERIKVQATWQKYVDSAISSTINLKEDVTVREIKDIYIQSYKEGLKGVTVFRDNCYRTGILNTEKSDKEDKFKCPECGHVLNMAEGCNSCPECGWGQCSI